MIDERFFSNSFPLGFLKHLPTISFPDSLDKLNDERDVKDEDENCNLSLFSPLDLDFFFSFCYSVSLSLSLSLCSTLYFFSFLLNCLVSLAYLVRKSLDFLIPSLLAHHMSYLQFYRFLSDLITEFTKTFTSY